MFVGGDAASWSRSMRAAARSTKRMM